MIDSTAISALSVLGGSLVGALTSLASTWLTQQHQDRRELLGKQIVGRETLYASFIAEASRVVVDSLASNPTRIDGLIPLYALFGRIQLRASEPVVAAAERVITGIIAEYLGPKSSTGDIQKITFHTQGGWWAAPLAEFSRVCREELLSLTDSDHFADSSKDPPTPEAAP